MSDPNTHRRANDAHFSLLLQHAGDQTLELLAVDLRERIAREQQQLAEVEAARANRDRHASTRAQLSASSLVAVSGAREDVITPAGRPGGAEKSAAFQAEERAA
jgi:hypothetical protein